MQFTPQPESCVDGFWADAIKQAENCASFLSQISDIRQYLLQYKFTPDTGEFGVRRINGCFPKQRVVWLQDAVNQKIGLNCVERSCAFIAWHVVKNGEHYARENFRLLDVLISPELRHVFPLTKSGEWVYLTHNEDEAAAALLPRLKKLLNSEHTNVTPSEDFKPENDPTIMAMRTVANAIEQKFPVAYANAADIRHLLREKFPGKESVVVTNEQGAPLAMIGLTGELFANADAAPNGFGKVISDALDPLLNKAGATVADKIKDRDGNIPLKHRVEIDPNVLVVIAGVSVLALVSLTKRSK